MAKDLRVSREEIRIMVRGTYDIQKIRIQVGNRINANIKANEENKVISERTERTLMQHCENLAVIEQDMFADLKDALAYVPIWRHWLKAVKGVGPAMGGVIVSEYDIHKAHYVASLWKYAGLDVVVKDEYYCKGYECPECSADVAYVDDCCLECGSNKKGKKEKLIIANPLHVFNNSVELLDMEGNRIEERPLTFGEGRSKRKAHLEERSYINKDGKEAKKMGITFNPFLKSKLLGVLAVSFLRVGAEKSPYAKIYYDYKNRIEQQERFKDHTKLHIHNMALRYMIKQFLKDLYINWREIEGLPVNPSYEEKKLGMIHHSASEEDKWEEEVA